MRFKIVNTDNYDSDYPHESFVDLPACSENDAQIIANIINEVFNQNNYAKRYWKVVKEDYNLIP